MVADKYEISFFIYVSPAACYVREGTLPGMDMNRKKEHPSGSISTKLFFRILRNMLNQLYGH